MRVGDLVTRLVRHVDPHASIASIESELIRDRVVAVFDREIFLGLVTPADLLVHPHSLVADCISDLPWIATETSAEQALRLMEDNHYHFLPATAGNGFAGVLSYAALAAGFERQQRDLLQAYRDIFEHTADAIFVHDPTNGVIVQANRAASLLTGVELDDLKGMHPRDFTADDSEHRSHIVGRWITASTTVGKQVFDWPLRRTDGSIIWAEVTLSALTILGEYRVLAVARDVTIQRTASQIAARARHLELLRVLAAGTAHDFKNAMFVIRGNAELARGQAVGMETVGKHLSRILECVDKTDVLVGDLLDFASLDVPRDNRCGLSAVLEREIGVLAGTQMVTIDDGHQGDWQIAMAESDLERVFANLLINAAQNVPEDDGRVTVIIRGTTEDGRHLVVSVEDNGPGVPMESSEEIFDPRFSTRAGGHGIGLALVQALLEAHGGNVRVGRSELGGAAFCCTLPLATSQPALDPPASVNETSESAR